MRFGSEQRFAITRGGVVLGRGRGCEIHIDGKAISRRHARIGCDERGWFVEDLESVNGVFVNHVPVRKSVLRESDLVVIGSVIFRFVAEFDAPADDTDDDSSGGTPLLTTVV